MPRNFVSLFGSGGDVLPVAGGAGVSLVQQKSATGDFPSATLTATLDSVPTNGNLLVAVMGIAGASDSGITNPAGWSQAVTQSNSPTYDDVVRICYKVASGDPAAVTFTTVGNNHLTLRVFEFAVPTGTPLDVSASVTVVDGLTSKSSGTTGATAQASEVSVVGFGARTVVSSPSLTNGFLGASVLATSGASLISGYHIESSIGTKESTASWTTPATGTISCIATFKML